MKIIIQKKFKDNKPVEKSKEELLDDLASEIKGTGIAIEE